MLHKGAPIHSIEVQIYKAALVAKQDGVDNLIFGESADVNYGGLDKLLSKDYLISEFVERFCYLMPHRALKEPYYIMDPILKYSKNGYVNVHEFERHHDYCESMGSYTNALNLADCNFIAPYSRTYLAPPLDLEKVRSGNSKYFVRDIFSRLYPNFSIPNKIPMPRPMNEWMKDWAGPKRAEFLPNCHLNLTGDQRWMVWALEKYLNLLDERSI